MSAIRSRRLLERLGFSGFELGELGFIDGFRLRTGNPGERGCRYHAVLALLCFFTSCSQRAQLVNDTGYREADDDQPGDCKAEQHDSRYHLAEQRQAAPRDACTDIAAASGKLIGQEKIVRSIRGSFRREQRQQGKHRDEQHGQTHRCAQGDAFFVDANKATCPDGHQEKRQEVRADAQAQMQQLGHERGDERIGGNDGRNEQHDT